MLTSTIISYLQNKIYLKLLNIKVTNHQIIKIMNKPEIDLTSKLFFLIYTENYQYLKQFNNDLLFDKYKQEKDNIYIIAIIKNIYFNNSCDKLSSLIKKFKAFDNMNYANLSTIISTNYKLFQPIEIINLFNDLTHNLNDERKNDTVNYKRLNYQQEIIDLLINYLLKYNYLNVIELLNSNINLKQEFIKSLKISNKALFERFPNILENINIYNYFKNEPLLQDIFYNSKNALAARNNTNYFKSLPKGFKYLLIYYKYYTILIKDSKEIDNQRIAILKSNYPNLNDNQIIILKDYWLESINGENSTKIETFKYLLSKLEYNDCYFKNILILKEKLLSKFTIYDIINFFKKYDNEPIINELINFDISTLDISLKQELFKKILILLLQNKKENIHSINDLLYNSIINLQKEKFVLSDGSFTNPDWRYSNNTKNQYIKNYNFFEEIIIVNENGLVDELPVVENYHIDVLKKYFKNKVFNPNLLSDDLNLWSTYGVSLNNIIIIIDYNNCIIYLPYHITMKQKEKVYSILNQFDERANLVGAIAYLENDKYYLNEFYNGNQINIKEMIEEIDKIPIKKELIKLKVL